MCCSPWGHKGSDRTEVNWKVKNCALNKELVYFRPQAQLLACRTSVGFPWRLCDWHCWVWGPVNTGRGGSTEALNKRHREPALSNSYIKQTNQPLLATHRPNLLTRTLKVFSDGLGLFVCWIGMAFSATRYNFNQEFGLGLVDHQIKRRCSVLCIDLPVE